MLVHEEYAVTDLGQVRALVRDHGWALLASPGAEPGAAPVVSHLPVVLEEAADDRDATGHLVVLGHLGRTDGLLHRLGEQECTLVIQGPNGYVSPSFYAGGPYVPTWNFVVAHLSGRPEVLDEAGTRAVLEQTVDRFESPRPHPWRLDQAGAYADSLVPHVTAFRLAPTSIVAKAKLSQDKPRVDVDGVIRAYESDPVATNPALAEAMRRTHR